MAFNRMRKKDTATDTSPPPPPADLHPAADTAPKGNIFQRIRNYLIDSYNGLYKILLSGYVPKGQTFRLIFVGLAIGLIWAYVIAPPVFYNAAPAQMSPGAQEQWIKLVAGSYEAKLYDADGIVTLLQQVDNPEASAVNLANSAAPNTTEQRALQNIVGLASTANPGSESPTPPSLISEIVTIVLPFIIILIALPILNLAWKVLLYQYVAFPIIDFFKSRTDKEYVEEKRKRAAELDAIRKAREAEKNLVAEVDEQLGDPIIQRLSNYRKGRKFDDSFEIEDDTDMFLGECGIDVSARSGPDDEPAAVNVWIFDMFDNSGPTPGLTMTKVFTSEQAYRDPAVRSQIDLKVKNPATDVIVATPGSSVTIDTENLRMKGEVLSLNYGTDGLPNSYFQEIQIKLSVWQKAADKKGAPAGLPPMPQPVMPMPEPYQPAPSGGLQPLAPPPLQMPSQPRPPIQPLTPPPLQPLAPPPLQPAPGGLRPLTPPPLQMQPDEDDDPFGGTGDFTPIGN